MSPYCPCNAMAIRGLARRKGLQFPAYRGARSKQRSHGACMWLHKRIRSAARTGPARETRMGMLCSAVQLNARLLTPDHLQAPLRAYPQ